MDTPFTEYGEFNEEADEAAETKFFQYGRFFGVSLGVGIEGVTGNRGLLWGSGFPMLDFKVHYWFDFNNALDLGFFNVKHMYEVDTALGGQYDVTMFRFGVDVKHYFDTKDLSAAISFANPYVLLGAGSFTKTEVPDSAGTAATDTDSAFGLSVGGGLEFVITPRKSYFELEGKLHTVTFKDTYSSMYNSYTGGDLSGYFYTVTANVLFTW